MSFLNDWVASQYMGTGNILEEYGHRQDMQALKAQVNAHRESALSWKRYAQDLEQQVKGWQQQAQDLQQVDNDLEMVTADKHYRFNGWRLAYLNLYKKIHGRDMTQEEITDVLFESTRLYLQELKRDDPDAFYGSLGIQDKEKIKILKDMDECGLLPDDFR